ncbi:MAG: hypothetical protein IJ621_02225 [Paludibacteraceae bacterium]|nr:hypothetical protein [Paludibacteraceae bacterium]
MKDLEDIKKRLRDLFAESATDLFSGDDTADKKNDTSFDDIAEEKTLTRRNNTSNDTPSYSRGTAAFLRQVAKRNQFKLDILHKFESATLYSFKYQGGYFIVRTENKNNGIFIQFARFAILPYTHDNYIRALQFCHRCNLNYSFAKFNFNYEEESNQLMFNISVETIEPSEQVFINYLEMCLGLANETRDYISGSKKDRLPQVGPMPDDDEDFINLRRDLFRLAQAEMKQEDKAIRKNKPKAQKPKNDTLAEYLNYLFDGEEQADLLALTIQKDNQLQEITDPATIADTRLLNTLIKGSGKRATFATSSPVVFTLDATTNHYIFSLYPLLNEPDFLSARLTAVRTPHEFLQAQTATPAYTPQAVSLKLCFAKNQRKTNQKPSDSAKRLFPESPAADLFDQFQEAHNLVQNEFYIQAIVLLQPIYEQMKLKYWELRGHDRDLFFAVCYDIGYCYTEMQLFEKAYFYLDITRNSNRYDCEQMYFNSLAEGRDPRIFEDLQGEIEEIRNSIQSMRADNTDDEDDNEDSENIFGEVHQVGLNRMIEYYAFLLRRLGYAQINFGYLDAAEETFRQLLKHEGSREYAKKELKHIATLRTNEQRRRLH